MPIPLFDGHCDTVFNMLNFGNELKSNNLHLDLDRTAKYRPYAQIFAIWDEPEACRKGDRFTPLYNNLISELDKNSEIIILCKSANEAQSAFEVGKAAAFISVEGAHIIYCSLELLEMAYDKGVRALNITWNNANKLSGSHIEEPERGLSNDGKKFVRFCNRLGIMVDVSHLSEPGFWDVCETTSSPIIASHSNSRRLCGHTRNLSDDQFKAIIKLGGVAGINLFPDFIGEKADIKDVLKHIKHFLDLGGEKNISIGSDFDGVDMLCAGISGVGDMDKLYDAMLSDGIPEKVAEDIFFNNLFRVVKEICAM